MALAFCHDNADNPYKFHCNAMGNGEKRIVIMTYSGHIPFFFWNQCCRIDQQLRHNLHPLDPNVPWFSHQQLGPERMKGSSCSGSNQEDWVDSSYYLPHLKHSSGWTWYLSIYFQGAHPQSDLMLWILNYYYFCWYGPRSWVLHWCSDSLMDWMPANASWDWEYSSWLPFGMRGWSEEFSRWLPNYQHLSLPSHGCCRHAQHCQYSSWLLMDCKDWQCNRKW